MTLYEKFKTLDIDLSHVGFGRGDARGGYFCTPKGAEVIGWAGVDGIHYCFVEGFGGMVFVVSPMNPAGDCVHPAAQSFEDFLRLLLACGDAAAIEQAWMWNRGEFDAFLETYPPDSDQRAALDELADKLTLAPMEDPYGYIKEVQSSFDYGQIPYSEEYYDLVPSEPEEQEPPERPEWKVYFGGGFGSYHRGHDRPGKEIPVNKTFTWGGKVWHIPAVYACGKGLVVDLCVEIKTAGLRAFMEKWRPLLEGGRGLTQEEQERQIAENPMTVDYDPKLTVNGKELRQRSGAGSGWTPMSCRPEEYQRELTQQDRENLWLMEHYGLDPELGWMFWRDSYPWATKSKPVLKTISLSLEQRPITVPGPRFSVSGVGDKVEFTHPVTGEVHTLQVVEYQQEEINMAHLPDGWECPTHCTAMSYTVEPELPRESLTVRDCGQGDAPRPKPPEELAALAAIGGVDGPVAVGSVGIIGGVDGPTAIILANGKAGHPRAVCSALRFEPQPQIEWRMVFYQKMVDGISVDLLS